MPFDLFCAILTLALRKRQAVSHIPGEGVRPMRITLHIGRFTVTIIVKSRTATLAGDGFL